MNANVHKTCGGISNSIARPANQFARLDPAGDTVHLTHHEHMTLAGACGWTITALSGSAWITQDGDVRDILLEAGQSIVLDRNGPAIISSFGDTSLRIAGNNRAKAQRPANLRLRFLTATGASYA